MSEAMLMDFDGEVDALDLVEVDIAMEEILSTCTVGALDPRRRIEQMREEKRLRQLLAEVYDA